jgi:hypothetical protein
VPQSLKKISIGRRDDLGASADQFLPLFRQRQRLRSLVGRVGLTLDQ